MPAEPMRPRRVSETMATSDKYGRAWQIAVGVFVALGMVATAAVAIIETLWG